MSRDRGQPAPLVEKAHTRASSGDADLMNGLTMIGNRPRSSFVDDDATARDETRARRSSTFSSFRSSIPS